MNKILKDVKPSTPIISLDRESFRAIHQNFCVGKVAEVVGMSQGFIRRVVGHSNDLKPQDVLKLLDQDSFSETFVPRSQIPAYLMRKQIIAKTLDINKRVSLHCGNSLNLIETLPKQSINCVVTSTPYWAMRLYEGMQSVRWEDGNECPFGLEQTPEEFIRHSVEVLVKLKRAMTPDGSIWWNIMDTYNTRTQIRNNAAEALRAMQGHDKTGWGQHACRRYSAGHSYLKDGEQCLIPIQIAARASRAGLYVKSVISWAKINTMPEPQNSRVSRNIEYVLHLTLTRAPYFDKEAYRKFPARLGGKNNGLEADRLSDYWYLASSPGRDGHGAQFPLAMPARCIILSTKEDDVVFDPFVGAGTTAVASKLLKRKFVGFDISQEYLEITKKRLNREADTFIEEKEPLHETRQVALL